MNRDQLEWRARLAARRLATRMGYVPAAAFEVERQDRVDAEEALFHAEHQLALSGNALKASREELTRAEEEARAWEDSFRTAKAASMERAAEMERQLIAARADAEVLRAEAVAPPPKRYPPWAMVTAITWVFIGGVLIGGFFVPHINDEPTVIEAVEEPGVPVVEDPIPTMGETTTEEVPEIPVVKPTNLAWAPVPDATAYVVQIWDWDRLIITERVLGTTYTLRSVPGEYQWIVYPVFNGAKSNTATVNSVIEVSP